MRWFENLSTRSKHLIAFGVMVALLLVTIATAYTALVSIRDSQRLLVEKYFPAAVNAVELRADWNRQRHQMLELMLSTNRAEIEASARAIRARAKDIDAMVQAVSDMSQSNA